MKEISMLWELKVSKLTDLASIWLNLLLKIEFKAPTIFLPLRGMYQRISKLTYHETLSLCIYPFVAFLTTSKHFFVYQRCFWSFGGILSTKGFHANFVNFRGKFWMVLCASWNSARSFWKQCVHRWVNI